MQQDRAEKEAERQRLYLRAVMEAEMRKMVEMREQLQRQMEQASQLVPSPGGTGVSAHIDEKGVCFFYVNL